MQKLIKAFEDIMVAITFAEAGEYDEARKIGGQERETEAVASSQAASKTVGKA